MKIPAVDRLGRPVAPLLAANLANLYLAGRSGD